MVTAFGTLANDGQKVTPHFVREVIDRDGNRTYTGNKKSERVISSETAQLSTYVLKHTLERGGTAADAALPGRMAAGKTGTSSGPKSAWFAAYIPQMVTVVDMYAIEENGTEAILAPFGGVSQVAGGNFPPRSGTTTWWLPRRDGGREVPQRRFSHRQACAEARSGTSAHRDAHASAN